MTATTDRHGTAPVVVTVTRQTQTGEYGRAMLVTDTDHMREGLHLLLDTVLDLRMRHHAASPDTTTAALVKAAGVALDADYSWEGLWLTATVTAPDDAHRLLGLTEPQVRAALAEHGWLLLADAIRAWGRFIALVEAGDTWAIAARVAAYAECLGLPEAKARRVARRRAAAAQATPQEWQARLAAFYREITR